MRLKGSLLHSLPVALVSAADVLVRLNSTVCVGYTLKLTFGLGLRVTHLLKLYFKFFVSKQNTLIEFTDVGV